jgi:hypothetical protein
MKNCNAYRKRRCAHLVCVAILCVVALAESDCGTAGSPPTNLAGISVTVQPPNVSLSLGQTQQFQAIVTGSSNTIVVWGVNGATGGSATTGTISSSGLYTAPAALPSPPSITVTAISEADPQARASATVTLSENPVVTVSPPTASVPTGGAQVFTVSVTGTGSTATSVTWSVNGITGGNATLGTISATSATTALYTAPAVPPSPATVTVTATSAADSSKSGSATVTVTCPATNSISPSAASVALNQTQTYTASFCIAVGASIVWDVNGIAGGNSTLGTIAPSGSSAAVYTAPAIVPASNPVTIHATVSPQPSSGPETAAARVTITSNVGVSVTPPSATLLLGQRASFAPTVTNASDITVTWSVNGIPNGSASVGQVCQLGTNPCTAPTGPSSGSVDYVAPASVPAANPVTLTATSHADPSRTGSSTITIAAPSGPVGVSVSPAFAFVPPSTGTPSTQQFFALVANAGNTNVTWTVQSAVAGQGCAGTACGSITASGLYSAPAAAPSPNAISVIATSVADPTKSASATVAIASGPTIEKLLPSSTMAGAVQGFPLSVQGVNFIAGSGSSASMILLNGSPRTTTCQAATGCTTVLNPSDVQSPGTLMVQVQNPATPAELSNPVPFVIVPFDVSVDTISLSSSSPVAAGKDIVLVEPTTAAASSPINVDFIGFLTGGNTCGVQGSPLTVMRPSSGSSTVSLCVHGTGLDPTFTYAFTAPSRAPGGSDIGITASAVAGLFANEIKLDLMITNTTLPGVRALFITTLNNDRAVATGMLEVK